MNSSMFNYFEAIGIPLIMIGIMLWFSWWIMKCHKRDKQEWLHDHHKVQIETNKVMTEITDIISKSSKSNRDTNVK